MLHPTVMQKKAALARLHAAFAELEDGCSLGQALNRLDTPQTLAEIITFVACTLEDFRHLVDHQSSELIPYGEGYALRLPLIAVWHKQTIAPQPTN